MKINTINKKITSLKVYNDWLMMNGMVEDIYIRIKKDKVRIADGSEEEVSVLTEEQVERFLLSPSKTKNLVESLYFS